MTCEPCDDRGIFIWAVVWSQDADGKPRADYQYAVCLCKIGQVYRQAENRGTPTVPLWRVWCAREQVNPDQVYLLEEAASAEELVAWGFRQPEPASGLEAVVSAAREKGRAKL